MSLTVAEFATAIFLHEDDGIEKNRAKRSNQMRGAGSRYSSWLYFPREPRVAPEIAPEAQTS
jgi:hypothetical protein